MLPSSYLEGQQAPIASRGKKSFGLLGLQGKSEQATALAILEDLAQGYSSVRGHHSSATLSQGSLTNHPAGKTRPVFRHPCHPGYAATKPLWLSDEPANSSQKQLLGSASSSVPFRLSLHRVPQLQGALKLRFFFLLFRYRYFS